MIAGLRGRLARWDEPTSTAWLDVGGVIYEVLFPAFAYEWLTAQPLDEEIRIYTYYHVSERSPTPVLIGFQHRQEREFFRKFIEVPDVGPAKAVRALARPVSEIARWVEAQDTRSLEQLPGIGKRLSQTIVAQLSGKLVEEALLRDERDGVEAPSGQGRPDLREDAVAALVTLQYQPREAERLVHDALLARPDIEGLEELLRVVLEQQAPP